MVEGIALSEEGAERLIEAGVGRLELCAALELGGLTPSLGTVRALKKLNFPFVAMVRPRASGFCYSDREFATMLEDVALLVDEGAGGVVVGFVNAQREVDAARAEAVVKVAKGREVVFNRAFDATLDPYRSLDRLIAAGVKRVLTTGHAKTAIAGVVTLRKLVERANGQIEILAGGGVRSSNAAEIVRLGGVDQIHLGPVAPIADPSVTPNVPYDPTYPEADIEEVRRTCELFTQVWTG